VLGRSGMDLKDNYTDLAFETGHRRKRGQGALKKQMLPDCRHLRDSLQKERRLVHHQETGRFYG
jgi:hypothetical protein